jgi:hypothetical protein
MTDIGLTYTGHPCRTCGSTERYLSRRRCVRCKKAKRRAHYLANPARYQELKTASSRRRRDRTATRPRPALCEMCGGPPTSGKAMCWDHDHVTGAFRGWLCSHCNSALGLLGDQTATAISRLQRYAARIAECNT